MLKRERKTLKGFIVFLCLTVCLSFSTVTVNAAETEQPLSQKPTVSEAGETQSCADSLEDTEAPDSEQPVASEEDIRNTKIVDFKIIAKKKDRIKFTWDAESESENVKLDGYKVFRSIKKGGKYGKYSVIWTTTANSKKCTDVMIKSKKNYRYKVRGFVQTPDGLVYTKYSKVIKVKTL